MWQASRTRAVEGYRFPEIAIPRTSCVLLLSRLSRPWASAVRTARRRVMLWVSFTSYMSALCLRINGAPKFHRSRSAEAVGNTRKTATHSDRRTCRSCVFPLLEGTGPRGPLGPDEARRPRKLAKRGHMHRRLSGGTFDAQYDKKCRIVRWRGSIDAAGNASLTSLYIVGS